MGYADDTTIYAVIPTPLSLPQVMELRNQDLAAIVFLCLKWYMRLNSKKTKSILLNRSRTYAPYHGGLTLGDAELQEVKSLRIYCELFS